MNKILIGIIIIAILICFLNKETFNSASMQNANASKETVLKKKLGIPCSRPRHSREFDFQSKPFNQMNAICNPLDNTTQDYYNYNDTTIICAKGTIPTVTRLAQGVSCTATGGKDKCAINSATTGTVVICK